MFRSIDDYFWKYFLPELLGEKVIDNSTGDLLDLIIRCTGIRTTEPTMIDFFAVVDDGNVLRDLWNFSFQGRLYPMLNKETVFYWVS